jgi:hypothetical protein
MQKNFNIPLNSLAVGEDNLSMTTAHTAKPDGKSSKECLDTAF